MPLGDQTGPMGFGPMSGRAAGFCAGYGMPGYANPVYGRGRGFGRGRGLGFRGGWGRGFGRGFGFGRPWAAPYAPYSGYGNYPPAAQTAQTAPTAQDELSALQRESEYLKTELDNINRRISELQSEKE